MFLAYHLLIPCVFLCLLMMLIKPVLNRIRSIPMQHRCSCSLCDRSLPCFCCSSCRQRSVFLQVVKEIKKWGRPIRLDFRYSSFSPLPWCVCSLGADNLRLHSKPTGEKDLVSVFFALSVSLTCLVHDCCCMIVTLVLGLCITATNNILVHIDLLPENLMLPNLIFCCRALSTLNGAWMRDNSLSTWS